VEAVGPGHQADPKKLNPISGAKNIFGKNALFELGKNLAKVGTVGAVVAVAVLPNLDELSALVGMEPEALSASCAARSSRCRCAPAPPTSSSPPRTTPTSGTRTTSS
jgi:flagellar biosynthesis protein FlhB